MFIYNDVDSVYAHFSASYFSSYKDIWWLLKNYLTLPRISLTFQIRLSLTTIKHSAAQTIDLFMKFARIRVMWLPAQLRWKNGRVVFRCKNDVFTNTLFLLSTLVLYFMLFVTSSYIWYLHWFRHMQYNFVFISGLKKFTWTYHNNLPLCRITIFVPTCKTVRPLFPSMIFWLNSPIYNVCWIHNSTHVIICTPTNDNTWIIRPIDQCIPMLVNHCFTFSCDLLFNFT